MEKRQLELIIQSIENDGMRQGYDLSLIEKVSRTVTIPVVALGGTGNLTHMKDAYNKSYANGLAAGSMFVYQGKKQGVLIYYPENSELNF